jgi:hypothetical protein
VADQVMPDFFDTYTHFTYNSPGIKIAHPVPNQLLFRMTAGRDELSRIRGMRSSEIRMSRISSLPNAERQTPPIPEFLGRKAPDGQSL